jgi:hypothetical protein
VLHVLDVFGKLSNLLCGRYERKRTDDESRKIVSGLIYSHLIFFFKKGVAYKFCLLNSRDEIYVVLPVFPKGELC